MVAMDREQGLMGVAVQSHYFSVGSDVPWAEAGVGAVATQSILEVSYGPFGLSLMKGGKTSEEALRALVSADSNPEVRQVAMMDVTGRVSVHTGKKCIPEAGHEMGELFSAQANLMRNRDVWSAMAKAFRKSKGNLSDRPMEALEAGEAAGGDIRGKQSAAMLIVNLRPTGMPWKDRVLEIRVEDHPEPLTELRRLIRVYEAYRHADRGDSLRGGHSA